MGSSAPATAGSSVTPTAAVAAARNVLLSMDTPPSRWLFCVSHIGAGAAAAHGATPLPFPRQAPSGPPRELLGAEDPFGLHQHHADQDQRGDDLRQAVEGRQFESQKRAAALEWNDELRQDGHDGGAEDAAG